MGNASKLGRTHAVAWICLGMGLALLAIGTYIATLRSSSPAGHSRMDSALIEQEELSLRADTFLVTGADTMFLRKPRLHRTKGSAPARERRLPATRDFLGEPVPEK